MYEPKMIYSDNPYIDAVVYYTKYLIVHSIIKDEEEALENDKKIETVKVTRTDDEIQVSLEKNQKSVFSNKTFSED